MPLLLRNPTVTKKNQNVQQKITTDPPIQHLFTFTADAPSVGKKTALWSSTSYMSRKPAQNRLPLKGYLIVFTGFHQYRKRSAPK